MFTLFFCMQNLNWVLWSLNIGILVSEFHAPYASVIGVLSIWRDKNVWRHHNNDNTIATMSITQYQAKCTHAQRHIHWRTVKTSYTHNWSYSKNHFNFVCSNRKLLELTGNLDIFPIKLKLYIISFKISKFNLFFLTFWQVSFMKMHLLGATLTERFCMLVLIFPRS